MTGHKTTVGKEIIKTDGAPAAVGPYVQAVKENNQFVYTAGQIGLCPRTMKLVGDCVQLQTKQAMENLRAVLAASGCGFDQVVKTTIFITSMSDFKQVNEVYTKFFNSSDLPARSCVAVKELPLGAKVEIEFVAYRSGRACNQAAL